jgi:hypothetical protein
VGGACPRGSRAGSFAAWLWEILAVSAPGLAAVVQPRWLSCGGRLRVPRPRSAAGSPAAMHAKYAGMKPGASSSARCTWSRRGPGGGGRRDPRAGRASVLTRRALR